MREIRFGIIGGGLMGREFASAAARWCHLLEVDFRPVLVGLCDTNPAVFEWYRRHFASLRVVTTDYRQILSSPDIDAV
ncbi:MAG: gfo/Idh/MocA family oxidoreductase, partial [Planctomycetota bacterium]